ncbi:hypothetical protein HC026_07035 [Lactobacillus sp. LC28-10]|uniref:Uncharacterized protein n=1 Tax=Secundilactobacillus angelensis TaxID=2722706 RepID=A0ABX1L0C7_9LACO|nr:hypothetical protein [Secundilactobacillus angelensis]MCH5462953.1 hypothetical protein [Secundilactobacillus angelensis]NLR18678.1 hypothetical protein [Secundilactobacillus angelensis]
MTFFSIDNKDHKVKGSKRNAIKLTTLTALTMLTTSVAVVPLSEGITAQADTVTSSKTMNVVNSANVNTFAQTQLVKEADVSQLIQNKINDASEAQMAEITQKVKAATTITTQGGQTTMEVKDAAVEHAYLSVLAPNVLVVGNRSSGVTKIVWHGAVKKGNVDIYLSKNTIIGGHAGLAAVNLIKFGVNMYAENYFGAVKSFGAAIDHTVKASKVKNGKMFKMRHWKYAGSKNQ